MRDITYSRVMEVIHDLHANYGIRLITFISEQDANEIINFFAPYDEIAVRHINRKNQTIALEYKELGNHRIDYTSINKLAQQYYSSKDYYHCIDTLKLLIANCKKPKAYVYGKIGFSYLMLKDKKKATEYFYLANEIAQTEEKKEEYVDILFNLTNGIKNQERKKHFYMKEQDFNNDAHTGLDCIKQIKAQLIKVSQETQDTCEDIGLDPQKTNIDILIMYYLQEILADFCLDDIKLNMVKLILAKDYYTSCQFDFGDKLVKQVEQSEAKNSEVIKLMNEVRKRKRFYQFQPTEAVQKPLTNSLLNI